MSLNFESKIAQDGLTAWLSDPVMREAVLAKREANILRGKLESASVKSVKPVPKPAEPEPVTSLIDLRFMPLMALREITGPVAACTRAELWAIYDYNDGQLSKTSTSLENILFGNNLDHRELTPSEYFHTELIWILIDDLRDIDEFYAFAEKELEKLLAELQNERFSAPEWERTVTVTKTGMLEIPHGFRRDYMTSHSIPWDTAADIFDAAWQNFTAPDLKRKNGNFQAKKGERHSIIFKKYQGVDWRNGPLQQAYAQTSRAVLATPGQGRYFSIKADIADPDGTLRNIIRGQIHELDIAMRCFNQDGYYPQLIDNETLEALQALAEITRRISRVKLSTIPGNSYKLTVPKSFRTRTLFLIDWFNDKFPWFRISKHDKNRAALVAPWVGNFLTDVMARIYPKVEYDTVGLWIDLVLGAQNDLR